MTELAVPDAYAITPRIFADDRGRFLETYQGRAFEPSLGYRLTVAQTNLSVSRRGVVRGLHYADVPPGQAKYVTCIEGAVLDIAVDIRVGSPSFGVVDAVVLDDTEHRAVFLSEGLGHCFVALTDDARVSYLCSTPYTPEAEHEVNPLDPALGLTSLPDWPADLEPLLSAKDAAAPTLAEAAEAGLLPAYDDCLERYEENRRSSEGRGQ
jgi:dTDP-4-dehydrorhamnose 3,5-epimerase